MATTTETSAGTTEEGEPPIDRSQRIGIRRGLNYFHQDGTAVTASSYSSRRNILVTGLSTGMLADRGRRYSVGIRLEPKDGKGNGRIDRSQRTDMRRGLPSR